MFDNLKVIFGGFFVMGNTIIQWLSDADTALKLLATIIAIPTAIFTGKFMYYQQKLKRMEIEELCNKMNARNKGGE